MHPYLKHLALGAWLVAGAACMSTKDGEQLQSNVFEVQKRLLELEHIMVAEGQKVKKAGDHTTKKVASASAQIDEIHAEITRLRGEVDAVRVGVQRGEMPGVVASDEEESIASRIRTLQERLTVVETAQLEMLDLLHGMTKDDKIKKRDAMTSIKAFRQALDAKQYRHISEDAPAALKKLSGKSHSELAFILAESLYKLGRLRDAALQFNELLANPDLAHLKAKMHMRLGDSFRHLGDFKAAIAFYSDLLESYPDSEEAKYAKEHVATLKKSPKNSEKS